MKNNKVVFFPKDANPYLKILKTEINKASDTDVIYGEPYIPFQIFVYRLKGYNTFHLHWLFPFQFYFFKKYGYIYNILSSLYLIIFVCLLKILSYKIVYTLHDITSHDKQFINEEWATKFILKYSDAVIVHSLHIKSQIEHAFKQYPKIYVIPHGNYANHYENVLEKSEAKIQLGLKQNDFVFLFFGMIKEYKGLDDLLREFSKLQTINQYKNLKLVIAGNYQHSHLYTMLTEYKKVLQDTLLLEVQHIEDERVQVYYNASDVVVLPFKKVTTSGSALLALTFKKPLIAPRIGAMNDLPENVGFFYSPTEENGLHTALIKAIDEKTLLPKLGMNGYRYVSTFRWENIAQMTTDVYKKLQH